MNDEQREYIEFWKEVAQKIGEVRNKYDDLSANNKMRADMEAKRIIQAKSLQEATNIINSLRF